MSSKRSLSIFSGLLAVVVASVCPAIAATPSIVATTTNLAPNTANQPIQFMITGFDSIVGENLNFQINGGISGPTINAVDILTNTIFPANNNTGQNNYGFPGGVVNSGSYTGRLAIASTTTAAGSVTDNGLLVTLMVSTVGVNEINFPTFQINLLDTHNGDSNLVLSDASTLIPFYPHNRFSIGIAERSWTFNGGGTWNLDSHWSPFAPYATGDPARFLGAITANSSVTLDGDRVAGSILFNNTAAAYTISQGSGGTLQLDNGAATPFITNNGGNHTLNVPLILPNNTAIAVTRAIDVLTISKAINAPSVNLALNGAGALLLGGGVAHSTGQITGSGNLSVDAAATLVSDGLKINSLQVNGNVTIRSSSSANFANGAVALNSLAFGGSGPGSWTGKLDLNNNGLIIDTGSSTNKATVLASVMSQVAQARNGGTWNGAGGITSSTVAATPAINGLAVADNLILGLTSYRGQSVNDNSLILVAAHLGDATLDGKVDAFDLTRLAVHWQKSAGALWSDGDFTGPSGIPDGRVDAFDLTSLAIFWQFNGGPPILAGGPQPNGAGVPEPASLATLAAGATLLLKRRRSA